MADTTIKEQSSKISHALLYLTESTKLQYGVFKEVGQELYVHQNTIENIWNYEKAVKNEN